MKVRAALGVLCLLASVLVVSPASAAPGKGAQHLHGEYHDGFIDYVSDELVHVTNNKNKYSLVYHLAYTLTHTYRPDCTESNANSIKYHGFTKTGSVTPQVEHFTATYTTVIDCAPTGHSNCTINQHYQLSNGEVRYERIEVTWA